MSSLMGTPFNEDDVAQLVVNNDGGTATVHLASEFVISEPSGGIGSSTVESASTAAVSIHCSSLDTAREMLINTIEVSAEELMSLGQLNSEEIEFVYSPTTPIQLHMDSFTGEEVESGVHPEVNVEAEQFAQIIESRGGESTGNLVPRLVVHDGKDVGTQAITNAILQAATTILNDPKATQKSNMAKKSAKLERLRKRLPAVSSRSRKDVIVTKAERGSPVRKASRIGKVVVNTIDGKQFVLQPDESVPVSPVVTLAAEDHISTVTPPGFPNVLLASNFEVESMNQCIIKTASVAQQTVAAAIAVQDKQGVEAVPNSELSATIQLEVPGGAPLRLQKYFAQQGLCRVCLLLKDRLVSIFEDMTVDAKGMIENARGPNACHKFNMVAALNVLLDVDVNYKDGLPHMICMDCYEEIMHFSVYRKKVAIGQSKLQKIMSQVRNSTMPTFIPQLGEVDMQNCNIYRHPTLIATACKILAKSQYSHLVLRRLSDHIWDKIFALLSLVVSCKSDKIRNLKVYVCEKPYVLGFFCYTCNSTIHGSTEDFAIHNKEFHSAVSSESVFYPCDICGNSFVLGTSHSQSYCEHWIQHFFLHECSFCSKKLPSARGLWSHKKTVHSSKEKIFTCDQGSCRRAFFTRSRLDLHKRNHLQNVADHVSDLTDTIVVSDFPANDEELSVISAN